METRGLVSQVFAGALLLGVVIPNLQADVLLSETFVAGDRLTQNLPSTAAWYVSLDSGGISDASGDLVSGGNRHNLAYFTDSTAASLDVGDTITVDFTFSLDTPIANTTGFRFGLLNSAGARISADNLGTGEAEFANYSGYAAFCNLQAATAMRLYERDGTTSESLINSGTPYVNLTGDMGTGATFVSGQAYDATFSLTRTETGMLISSSVAGLDGYSASYLDTTASATAFDTFVIYGASSAMSGYTLKSVDISVIPEPATIGMLGFGALGLLIARRWKTAK